jgi:hypothetical protein
MRMLFPILALAVAGCTSLPEGVTLSLAPEAPTTTDPLVATLSGDLGDPEKITWTFTWTVDGAAQADLTGEQVPADRTAKGQVWAVQAVATAGNQASAPLAAEVTIVNSPPVASGVTITPATLGAGADAVAAPVATDADGDTIAWTFAWTINGVAVDGVDGDTLAAGRFEKGESLVVTATPDDGEVAGAPVTSSASVVQNTPPSAPTVSITPAEPLDSDALRCVLDTPSTDPDTGDVVTYTLGWTVDGAAWDGPTHSESLTGDTIDTAYTTAGQTWTCAAVASDGTASSAEGASAPVTVAPNPTMTPGVVDVPFTYEGYSVRCRAWAGDVCVHMQQRVACDTCGAYELCDVWHDTTIWNNGGNRTALNFCAIATGDAGVVSVGNASVAITEPAACGYSTSEHPVCSAGRASVHVEGVGIDPNLGLLLDPAYCDGDERRLTVECSGW